jgi:aryl-alcohol dehydrogenase-like predicted oxidoreductase
MSTNRRELLQATAALGLSSAMAATTIPTRPLGGTGLQVSVMGLGGARIGNLPDQREATDVVKLCFDSGISYFDTASAGAYGLSQTRYGIALKGVRDKVVFATKTRHRTWTQAELDLNQSLSNLGTDHIDVYQIHNIINDEDIDFIFARRGVLEMIEKAKKDGKIRFVGITGHTEPGILNKVMDRYEFDTILIPLSVTDGANKQKSFEQETLPVAKRKGMGVVAMKTLGAGLVLQNRTAALDDALNYVWSLPVSTAILGCSSVEQVNASVKLAQSPKQLSALEMDGLRRRTAELALHTLEPWKGLGTPSESGYRAD